MAKERLDVLLTTKGIAPSREKAKALIIAGEVFIGTERVTRPDMKVSPDAAVEVRKNPIPFVSYGGVKLEKALDEFALDLPGKIAIDIGSSTGGFTDCLLQSGILHVFAIDAGTHQLHEHLRADSRVTLMENVNARYLGFDAIGTMVDIITIDVSFISLKKILPVTLQFLKPGGYMITLVKPQFEAGRGEVGKGGILKDPNRIGTIIADIKNFGQSIGLKPLGLSEAPREKERKNREFFILWER